MNIRSLKKIMCVLTFLMFMGLYTTYAQPTNHDLPPISGIGYLLALGGAFGMKKIYDIRKRNNLK